MAQKFISTWLRNSLTFGSKEHCRDVDVLRYIQLINKVCEVVPTESNDVYKLINNLDKSISIKINKNSITVNSKKLKKIKLDYGNEKDISLQTYINRNNNFIICFDDVEVVYWSKKLFKDSRLLGNLDYFLSTLVPYEELVHVTSEKGSIKQESTHFEENSLFYFVENTLDQVSSYMFCDDLGNEWADLIAVEPLNKIVFYHAKFGSDSLSASKFHEVVAQAQKNLGNIFASEAELERKKATWESCYAGSHIRRIN